MPHTAHSSPGSGDRPWFHSGPDDAAARAGGQQVRGQQVQGRPAAKAAGTRQKHAGGRSDGARGGRGGAIRTVHGRRIIPRQPLPPASILPPPSSRPRLLETRFRRLLVTGG
jgi:hypothetical protein